MAIRFLFIITLVSIQTVSAQSINKIINKRDVKRIEKTLSADDMQGRGLNTPGIQKAAGFIADEFKKAGLQPAGNNSYFQEFGPTKPSSNQTYLKNVIGILPGKSKEIIVFSAHYDHLGIGKPTPAGDSIYNGANDDAAGTTAVIMLARYFAKLNNNQRTLVFVAFTAEESGGFGSRYFSKQYDAASVMAMFNIEMIGTESKWGKNSAFITGYEKSNMGKILEKNLAGSSFKFYPDPYPKEQLFYRSDNATLARLGVPAHTISTSKMDSEKFYHTADDEIGTLNIKNMARIIRAIAISSKTIISGADTPSRVDTAQLN